MTIFPSLGVTPISRIDGYVTGRKKGKTDMVESRGNDGKTDMGD